MIGPAEAPRVGGALPPVERADGSLLWPTGNPGHPYWGGVVGETSDPLAYDLIRRLQGHGAIGPFADVRLPDDLVAHLVGQGWRIEEPARTGHRDWVAVAVAPDGRRGRYAGWCRWAGIGGAVLAALGEDWR